MKIPTLSVIILTHNRVQFIQRATASVLEQSRSHPEVIVVDDGSKDDTESIFADYTRKDSRVHFLRHAQQNGAQAVRNTGVRAAQGNRSPFWILTTNWAPDSLTLRLRVAKERAVQAVHSECYFLEWPFIPRTILRGASRLLGLRYQH